MKNAPVKQASHRMTFGEVFDKAAWTIMSGVAVYASTQLEKMSASVSQLNTNVAVLVQRVTSSENVQAELKAQVKASEDLSRDIDSRVRVLEMSRPTRDR